MIMKTLIATTAITLAVAAPAAADPLRVRKISKLDKRLTNLERRGLIEQGSRLDRIEDRIDRRENKIDRREDYRDRQVNNGPRDRIEDYFDRRENIRDRREDRWDRRH